MVTGKLSYFPYNVSCKVVHGSISCSASAITVLVWAPFWLLLQHDCVDELSKLVLLFLFLLKNFKLLRVKALLHADKNWICIASAISFCHHL